jgi:hypothetical protein
MCKIESQRDFRGRQSSKWNFNKRRLTHLRRWSRNELHAKSWRDSDSTKSNSRRNWSSSLRLCAQKICRLSPTRTAQLAVIILCPPWATPGLKTSTQCRCSPTCVIRYSICQAWSRRTSADSSVWGIWWERMSSCQNSSWWLNSKNTTI